MKIHCGVSLASAVFGTWLAGAAQAQVLTEGLVFHALTPCRVFDTRPGAGGTGPLVPGTLRYFFVSGSGSDFPAQGGTAGGCAIPGRIGSTPRAQAVMLNIVAVTPAGGGNLRAWPSDAATVPNASIINFTTGTNIANGVIVPLSQAPVAGPDIAVRADGAGTHVLGDVLGYFVLPDMGSHDVCYENALGGCTTPSLADNDNFLWGTRSNYAHILPGTNQTCLVTANVQVTASGPVSFDGRALLHTAVRNITDGIDRFDEGNSQPVGLIYPEAGAAKTYQWSLAANKQYRFGCYLWATGDTVGDLVDCTVSWVCR